MFNLYLTGEEQRITELAWTERADLLEKNIISVGEDRDVQDLFDGEATNAASDSSSESETESLFHVPDVKEISDEEI